MVKIADSIWEKEIKERKSSLRFYLFLSIVAYIIICMILLNTFVFFRVRVDGRSMVSTLQDGDILLVNKENKVSRGDVIIIDNVVADRTGKYVYIIKRVIATEGQVVELKGGYVYVDGEKLNEPYLDDFQRTNARGKSRYEIKKGEVFYLGDNRLESQDARDHGPCKISQIVGIVKPWSIKTKDIRTKLFKIFEPIAKLISGITDAGDV